VFSVRAPRFAMNRKVLVRRAPASSCFLSGGVTELGNKLGPIQLAVSAHQRIRADDFKAFLTMLPPEARGLKLRHVVEVRHESFRTPDFVALLRKFGRGSPAVHLPAIPPT